MLTLIGLLVMVIASVVLGAACAYPIVRWSKRSILWAFTPVFALLWFVMGAMTLYGYAVHRAKVEAAAQAVE